MKFHISSEAMPLSLLINTSNTSATVFKESKKNYSWRQNTIQGVKCHISTFQVYLQRERTAEFHPKGQISILLNKSKLK